MNHHPFLISTPIEMLAKGEREFIRLKNSMDIDTIFNFFVTAYHLIDYVKRLPNVTEGAINDMYKDTDFKMCQFICNRSKHLVVINRPKSTDVLHSGGSGTLGFGPVGSGPLGSLPEWHLIIDDNEVNPIELAERIIYKWREFFAANGLM